MTRTVSDGPTLTTAQLVLRRFREADREPFACMNVDPKVMRHFPATLDRAESDAFLDRIESAFQTHGYGPWAVERAEDGRFLGFTGLALPTFEATFTPCVEIGWRFVADAWGRGYATEAANTASRRVMERLEMHRDPADDFEHPRLPEGHPLRAHVLYRLRRDKWRERGRR